MPTVICCKRLLPDAREIVEMQLQFPDMLTAKENETVPLERTVQAELTDLMARVLVVVFQKERESVDDDRSLVQFQDQTRALGPQSHRLLAPVQRETGSTE